MTSPLRGALVAFGFGVAALSLGACTSYYGPAGYGPGNGVAYYEHSPMGFDGYYDDAYGPFYDGYWGDGGFYYSTGEGHPYQLDHSNHFRREQAEGFHNVHGGMHSGAHGPIGEHHGPQ